MNLLSKAIAFDLTLGLGLAVIGLIAPEWQRQIKQRAKDVLVESNPDLEEQLQVIEEGDT